ncbi:MAG TPA: gamma-glutamyl-gamma-aminobutyrate hydrolase family protein [Candidatus Dormibacteraeota bacterium]|nr:gamma-glutamyl-gamma-aminobutyrate hydrolase family protein [Candidatus Dormibacteraeota bacterium]
MTAAGAPLPGNAAGSALPLVLVACTVTTRTVPAGEMPTAGVNRAYVDALLAAGVFPVLVPPTAEGIPAALLECADGLLLPGGIDVDPGQYGEAAHPTTVADPRLDALERVLLERTLERERPVLAICRGVQSLNVALGGSLVQDLGSLRPGPVDHQPERGRDFLAHPLRLDPESRLAGVLGTTSVDINSLHHQGLARLGAGLRAVGWAEDGLVEAVELADRPFVIGVQFHPEELWRSSDPVARLFSAFGAAVRQAASERERPVLTGTVAAGR